MMSAQQWVVKWFECAAVGAMLLLLAKIAVHRLRQPADRIKVIVMAFIAAVLVPLLVAIVPAWHLGVVAAARTGKPLPPPASQTTAAREPSQPEFAAEKPLATRPQVVTTDGPAIVAGVTQSAPAPTWRDRLDPWRLAAIGLLVVHALAIVLLLAEGMIAARWLRKLSSRALPADKRLAGAWASMTESRGKRVRLLVTDEINTPLTYGCLRPTLVVPQSIATGDPAELRFCLAHEWSHVEHGDLRAWRLAWLAQFVLWFQPLFWMLRRELRACQDFVADHRAANAGEHAIEYSQLLVQFARRGMSRPVAGAMAFLDQSSQLSRRVKMLLASRSVLRPRSPLGFCVLAGITSLACAALLSAVRLESVEADEALPASTEKQEPAVSKEQPSDAKATSPKPADGETLRYTGIVLDKETGKGILDAIVVVRRSKYTSEENDVIEETRHSTDAEGKYSFEIPPEQVAVSALYIELDVDHHDYAAQKGFGYALSMIRKNEKLGERPFFEKVELRPSDPITGTVVAPDGKPLGGVKIQGYSKSNATDFRDYGSFTDTVTDDNGKFRLNLVKGGLGVLWVLPTEYASTSRAVNKDRGDVGEIRLRPGVRVAGRVVNVEGQPVPNIPVNIQHEGGGDETVNNLPVATSIRRSAITDQDGNFAFDPLPSGEYRLIPEEHRSDPIIRDRTRYDIPWVFLPTKVKLQEGIALAPIEVQASPHVMFNAQVLDSKGARTRGHEVHVFGRMDGQYWFGEGRPNSEGTISMRIPHGLQDVQLNLMTNEHGALRFRRGNGKELENRRTRVELGTLNDDIEGFEIIRYVAPVVLVSAVDADGQQVKDFRVTAAYPWGKQEYILAGEQRSDLNFEHQNDGRYRTWQMLPDEDVKFTVTAPGYEPASETVRLGEGESKDLVVPLKRKGEAAKPKADESAALHYSGVIIDSETAEGIADAAVVVRRSKSTSVENEMLAETRHTTDAEGKYSFEIPPEQAALSSLYVQLDVERPGYVARKHYGYALAMIRKNETLGERPFFERFELRPSDPISGRVVAADGRPLGGVKIQGYSRLPAESRDGLYTDTVTDDAGKFRLDLVKDGVGAFWVLPTEYASTSRAIDKKRGDVGEIRLRPGVRASGRVLSAEGDPVPNIPVNIEYNRGGHEVDSVGTLRVVSFIRRSALTNQDGEFAFDPLPSGEYRLLPDEERSDPIVRDRTRYDVPGVFLPVTVKVQEGVACAPIEVQACPHVVFNAQILDSKGAKARGHDIGLFGRLDGQYWYRRGHPNTEGAISLRVPHGLQNVQVNLTTTEHGALRFRRAKGKKLENKEQVELGALNDDVEGFEIVRYVAPIVLISAVDADGQRVKDFRVAAAYPWGKQEYILEGEQRSDLSFEHQNDGRYRTSQMLPDEDVKFTVISPGYEPASETVRLGEGETKDLVLTMKKS